MFINKKKIIYNNVNLQISLFNKIYNTNIEFKKHKYHNILRNDTKGTCFFIIYNNIVYLVDFTGLFNGLKLLSIENFIDIDSIDIDNINNFNSNNFNNNNFNSNNKYIIKIFSTKPFNNKDLNYWGNYGISENNLIEDNIQSVNQLYIENNKGKFLIKTEFSYAININNRFKIYRPFVNKEFKFIYNNTDKNDIGNLHNCIKNKNIFITKSYKDARVLRNLGYNNSIFFQSESTFPEKYILDFINQNFKCKYIIWDSDNAGITNAQKFYNIFDNIKLIFTNINEGKDLSDVYKNNGENFLINFLNQNINDK